MKPRKYQQEAVDEIINTLQDSERVCYTLATGGGKTALFSFFDKAVHWRF